MPGADVWSLGMVLLECLTGQRVYEGSTAQVVAKRMAGPVPLPGDLPVPWKLLLSGMLDHRPEQRLEGAHVAAIWPTSPFRAALSPSPIPDTTSPPSTGVLNLTALVPGSSTTALLPRPRETAPAPTRIALSESPTGPRRHRRWWPAVLGALLVIALVVALLAAFPSNPASNLGHLTSATQPPATSTTTSAPTTTTTTLAAIPAALAVLTSDIASDQSDGTIDQGAAESITDQAQQAVFDAAASQPDQAANHLQRAAINIDTGQLDGSIDPSSRLDAAIGPRRTRDRPRRAGRYRHHRHHRHDRPPRPHRGRDRAAGMATDKDKVKDRVTEEQAQPPRWQAHPGPRPPPPDRAWLRQPVRRRNSATRSAMGTRTCSVLSRSRTVTASSSRESKSTVTHQGVPTSS